MVNLNEIVDTFQGKVDDLVETNESLTTRLLALENVGWELIFGNNTDNGPTLEQLKAQAVDLQDMVISSPFMKRGCQLRHAYVFGRGIQYDVKTKRGERFMDDPYNRAALFSVGAYETMNAALFTDGNFFMLRNAENEMTAVPLSQISGVSTHPDDAQRIQYLKRSWTVPNADGKKAEERHMWYPLSRYKDKMKGKALVNTINEVPVSKTTVMHHQAAFRLPGWTFGVPDSMAAKIWTIAYSSYLKDNSLLVKALSQFAWKITTASKTAQDSAASTVKQPGVAGTAVMGEGNNLQAIPRAGSDVNFNNGQPLASAIATSLGVPVIGLLSSPGAGSGSYGAATTLDEPTLKGMTAIQESWRDFQLEVLRGVDPNANLSFPAISTDATYRQIASLGVAQAAGMLHQQETRDRVVDLMDITITDEKLPEPDFFNTWNDPTFIGEMEKVASGGDDGGNDPTPGQGKTGAVKGGVSQGKTDHSGDDD